MLRTTVEAVVTQETIKNLLSAQRRIAESGNAKDVIRISRYLLRLAEKREDILIDILPECEEQGSEEVHMGNRSKKGHWVRRKILSSGQIMLVWVPQGPKRRKKAARHR